MPIFTWIEQQKEKVRIKIFLSPLNEVWLSLRLTLRNSDSVSTVPFTYSVLLSLLG